MLEEWIGLFKKKDILLGKSLLHTNLTDVFNFNRMTQIEKEALILKQGMFLVFRMNDKGKTGLYSIRKFFVEVIYQMEENKILHIRAFKDNSLLAPYLARL